MGAILRFFLETRKANSRPQGLSNLTGLWGKILLSTVNVSLNGIFP